MSPRAAWRLEQLGYGPVYDYAAGKADWLAAGLPTVRAERSERRALDAADRDPPTCRPDDLADDVVAAGAVTSFVVISERRVVVGRYRAGEPAARGSTRVGDLMEPGPTTVRAHEPLAPLLDRMARRRVGEVIVTTPEGELLGVVRRPNEDR
jgi:CBS domain-containing protein